MDLHPLLVLLGPTAVGKTAVAIKVAERMRGEIISADSMQVYRHLNIGTAKPTLEEQERVVHHLVDVVEPYENFNVARFQAEVKRLVPEIVERGKLPIMVGGTGLYISAVVDNYEFSPGGPKYELRTELLRRGRQEGPEALYAELEKLDPTAASRIQPTDLRRVIRALEVKYSTGRELSRQGKGPPLYRALQIGLTMDRQRLYAAINARVDQMVAQGLIDETRWLLAQDYPRDVPAFQALGYKEIVPYLEGRATLTEVIETLKRETRRFAKRQLTWFRRDKRIIWFDRGDYSNEESLAAEIARLAEGEFLTDHE
ncbi:MAG: tRNA (adenosine(37)-N6)-dimethylallyltransferase MiaA [bacterium]|jgi:tRNA dimethylallyltransferase